MTNEFLSARERNETMEQPNFTVRRITDGLEFGDGAISGRDAEPEVLRTIDVAIHDNPDILVPVDCDDEGHKIDDDGCGDGRKVGVVQRGFNTLKRSLNRAKVFGGAVAMAAPSRIGLGQAHGVEMTQVFSDAMTQLDEHSIDYGAHTADHVAEGREESDSGCGAIDGAPVIAVTAAKYAEPIRGALKAFGLEGADVDEVLQNYREYAQAFPVQPGYRGKAVMQKIHEAGKVVKQLVGGHKERRIVINMVEGFTVNQQLIRELTNDKAQIFAVDGWRLNKIAQKLYSDNEEMQRKALISELVYTIGTAAVLTPGDMPIDLIELAAA